MQTYAPPVLATRLFPRSRVATMLLVVGFALLTAAAAQLVIPLPFTPVPITGQTFAVLLAGGVLGLRAGASSQALYVALGAVGLPVYAERSGGWDVFTGPTFGYLIGFILAAAVVGFFAERKQDRNLATSWPAFLTGSLVIYACGVSWLMISLGMTLEEAVVAGVVPFLVGDLLKALLAGALLPITWRLVGDR